MALKGKEMMKSININYDRCTGDGICAAVCPFKLIAFDDAHPTPTPIPEATELCIGCGHCMAACPTNAISLNGCAPEDCPTTDKDLWPSYDTLSLFFKSRRSVRVYKNTPVDPHTIEQLLDTCRYAPSSANSQPVNWIIASGKKRLRDLSQLVIDWMSHAVKTNDPLAERLHLDVIVEGWSRGEDLIVRGAPMVVMNHASETGARPLENCVIAMTYFDLAATSLGLGTCWLGYLLLAAVHYPPSKDALGIPHDHRLCGAMLVGHPKYSYHLIPPRKQAHVAWW
jgi:nitroreductase/NAD-dependent dihydropyrimidine dehydrogenase PreA subunit